MENKDFYYQSHLFVAAIRVLDHRNTEPPSVREVCETLALSSEIGHLICSKLHDMEIVEKVEGPYGNRLFIRNHLKLEDIPRDEGDTPLKEEIEKFQSNRKDFKQKIEAFQARKEQEQKELFAKIQEKFKKGM